MRIELLLTAWNIACLITKVLVETSLGVWHSAYDTSTGLHKPAHLSQRRSQNKDMYLMSLIPFFTILKRCDNGVLLKFGECDNMTP